MLGAWGDVKQENFVDIFASGHDDDDDVRVSQRRASFRPHYCFRDCPYDDVPPCLAVRASEGLPREIPRPHLQSPAPQIVADLPYAMIAAAAAAAVADPPIDVVDSPALIQTDNFENP